MEEENKKLGQEPAFPVDGQYALDALNSNNGGISKRLLIAKDFAVSIVNAYLTETKIEYTGLNIEGIVKHSYLFADELLRQENKTD